MSKDISSETSRREARITTRAPGSRGVRFGWVQALCSSAICLLFSSGVAQAQIPILNETTELTAADGAPVDFFGEFVAVDGDTIVAGAIRDDCPPGLGNTCGAAYVFIRDGAGWTQRAKLTASDAAAGDQFGSSVAVSGDTVVIGASQDDVRRGSAYVFVKPAGGWTGALTEDAKLTASDRVAADVFGISVAVSGDTVVIGSQNDDDKGKNSGSAYVFVKPAGGWTGALTENAKLNAADGGADHRFGYRVALDGDTAVIGAYRQSRSLAFVGAAYVFVKPAGGWTGTLTDDAKLTASVPEAFDFFGIAVAVSGDTVVAGGYLKDGSAGIAWLVEKPAGGWTGALTENAKLTASDRAAGDVFGITVAVSGDAVVVGAPGDDDGGSSSGSAYVFNKPAGGWVGTPLEDAKLLASDGAENNQFGGGVAISGGTTVIGAAAHSHSVFLAGAAYVFEAGPSDDTPPSITADVDGTLGNNGWYTSDVTVTWTVTDDESDVTSTTGCEEQNILLDTAGLTFTCTAESAGGSASEEVTIKRDATAPTISGSRAPAANGAGWNNTSVTASFSCSDGGSGIASCGPDVVLASEGAGQSATGTAEDLAGNTASADVSGINIDLTAPTISGIPAPPPNGAGWNNTDVTVSFTCADTLSGVDTCSGPETLTDEGAGQSSTGMATDLAGNEAETTVGPINIDKTAPTVQSNAPGTIVPPDAPISFTATAEDAGLGELRRDDHVVPVLGHQRRRQADRQE